jgi:hypothetical protein
MDEVAQAVRAAFVWHGYPGAVTETTIQTLTRM